MVAIQPIDFERRTIETVRRHLDDIPPCAAADYSVRWFDGPVGRMPALIIAFNLPQTRNQPALSIGLYAVSRSTGTMSPLEGDHLRDVSRRLVDQYLTTCGVVLTAPHTVH